MDWDDFAYSIVMILVRFLVVAVLVLVLIGPGALLLWAGHVAYAIPSLMAGAALLVFAIVSALQHAGAFR